MNTQRHHGRELRYRQAPAPKPPTNNKLFWAHTLAALAVGAAVVASLASCDSLPDDITTAKLAAADLEDAKRQSAEQEQEVRALAALMGSKQ